LITPLSKPKKTCDQNFYELVGVSGTLEQETSDLTEGIKDGFERNLSYNEVYKNNDLVTLYKTWIYEGNQTDKSVGFKYLQSYPYDTLSFLGGDYIHWQYGGELSTWLMVSIDKQHLFNVKGRIKRCNNNLKWYTAVNVLQTYPCVIEDRFDGTVFMIDRTFALQDGDIYITLRQDSITSTIQVNQRFLFDGMAFKVKGVKSFINDGTLYLTLYKDQVSPNDDVINDIADAGLFIEPIPSGTYTEITPEIDYLTQGSEQTYSVYKYLLDVQQADTFITVASGIPSQYYLLTVINGNSFKVKNIARYTDGVLTITCTNNIDLSVITKTIKLGGLF
jgi:hypothetical protein